MKKFKELYEEKQQHEEARQRYQEDHMDEMEIINLHKRCNKKTPQPKKTSKALNSRYHLLLREQLDKMTGEDRKNYCSIVSKMWKEIKEDPARLSAYNDRVRQIKNEAEKLGVDSQNEKAMADRLAVRLPKKALKSPEFVDTDLDDSDDEQEHIVKKTPKSTKTSRIY